MPINYRLLHIFVVLVLLMPVGGAISPAAAQQDCDTAAYLSQLDTDIQLVNDALTNFAATSAANAANTYIQIAEIRRTYEDMTQVPACAAVLHSLMIQWFSAAEDEVALILAIYADNPNAARYETLRDENQIRMDTLAQAATNEMQRLSGSSDAATPQPSAGDWYRVYFTEVINSENTADHHGAFMEGALIFLIDRAQSSIDAALFELNAPDTTAALVNALGRGVRVRLVVDDAHNLEDPDSTVEELIAAGAQVKADNRGPLMHSKFFIFDGIDVWTGSTNITRNGFYNNNNNSILIRSAQLAQNFQAEFEEMFTDGSFSRSQDSRSTPNPIIDINGTRIETYFSPENGRAIEQRLVELTTQSQRSIKFMAFSFTLSSISNAMISRLQAGVQVQGVFETVGSTRGRMPSLACAGANVRQDGNPDIMHHKVMIFDEQIVVLGSFNFSASARDSNTENVLIIHSPEIAAYYLAEFQVQFDNGSPPSGITC